MFLTFKRLINDSALILTTLQGALQKKNLSSQE